MSEKYTSTDIYFSACLWTAYGEHSLIRITRADRNGNFRGRPVKKYEFDVPTAAEAAAMFADYLGGRLDMSDVRALFKTYNTLTGIVKQMEREGQEEWTA